MTSNNNSNLDIAEYSPMIQQYLKIKQNFPTLLVFYRMGDFYELFFDDAVTASKLLGITLTSRNSSAANPIKMAGVPFHALDQYLAKLLKLGQSIVIVDQVGPVPTKGPVERKVTRIITPGTVSDEMLLEEKKETILAAIYKLKNQIGIAYLSISSGKFFISEINAADLNNHLDRIATAELVIPENLSNSINLIDKKISIKVFPDWHFNYSTTKQQLLDHFAINDLSSFGIDSMQLGIIASGVLLNYAKQMTHSDLSHLNNIVAENLATNLSIDHISRRNLEINQTLSGDNFPTLLSLIDKCATPMGSRLLRYWINNPITATIQTESRHQAVASLLNNFSEYIPLLQQICDIERISSRIALLNAKPRDLSALRDSLLLLPSILKELNSNTRDELLEQIKQSIESFPSEILQKLVNAIKDTPNSQIRDGNVINNGYNSQLDYLRDITTNGNSYLQEFEIKEKNITGITNLKVEYNRVHGFYIEISKSNLDKIPSNYQRTQTLKNYERYTTVELKKFEQEVLSAQEQALTLERELYLEVLNYLTQYILPLQTIAHKIATLDVLNNFAFIAKEYNYTRPTFTEQKQLKIINGRHPIVENQIEQFIANDISLSEHNKFLLITGPNMGGKSTYMRQTALIVLLAYTGSFVPATSCTLGPIDKIFTRIGASDDLSKGKSTFMVEMIESANILHNATPNSLVLMDEVGRGTSTFDGLSLANAIARYLIEKIQAYTLFATHYFELTELGNLYASCTNVHMGAVEHDDSIVFMHHIENGAAAKSYGIQVAQISGIPKTVILMAKRYLAQLEKNKSQRDLFAIINDNLDENINAEETINQLSSNEINVLEQLKNIIPDEISAKDALNILYKLKDELNRSDE
jgi:DNA mismatch repair protein MutS